MTDTTESRDPTIVLSINAHGTFYNATPIDPALNEMVTVLSISPPNISMISNKEMDDQNIENFRTHLKTNEPILDIFYDIKRETMQNIMETTENYKNKLMSDDNSSLDKQEILEYIDVLRQKLGMQIHKPHSDMNFNSYFNDSMFSGIIDIQVLDVRYPTNVSQLEFTNPHSSVFEEFNFEVTGINDNGDGFKSSLIAILQYLKNILLFKNIFIIIIACRDGEFETEYAKKLFNKRHNGTDDDTTLKRNDAVFDRNRYFKNEHAREFRKIKKEYPGIFKLGGNNKRCKNTRRCIRVSTKKRYRRGFKQYTHRKFKHI